MPFEMINSEVVYPGRAFTIRRETVRLPDGHETRLDVVDHIGSVIIVPLDSEGNLLFVRQYRHPTRQDLLELPAGTLNKGEEPDHCAYRELREETGMGTKNLEHLGGFFLAPGYSTEYMNVYLATGLYEDPLEADADEFLTLERLPWPAAMEMAEGGKLPDAKSLAALLLAKSRLARG